MLAAANAAVGRDDEKEYVTEEYVSELEAEMLAAAEALEFERAAAIRDRRRSGGSEVLTRSTKPRRSSGSPSKRSASGGWA